MREGQGKLMGSICCPRIPFILVMINQSHPLPLSGPYSVNPQADPKTHINTNVIVLFLCHDSHDPLCLWIHVSIFWSFLCQITSYHIFLLQSWCFGLLLAPLWFHWLHILYCCLFVAMGLCTNPTLNPLVYISRTECTDHSLALILLDSPLPCCLAD